MKRDTATIFWEEEENRITAGTTPQTQTTAIPVSAPRDLVRFKGFGPYPQVREMMPLLPEYLTKFKEFSGEIPEECYARELMHQHARDLQQNGVNFIWTLKSWKHAVKICPYGGWAFPRLHVNFMKNGWQTALSPCQNRPKKN